jgi:uncharacterized protein (TIGR03435 family)
MNPFANHVWQSTLFAGVAWLLTLALRKNHARIRYWIWLTASCKFLIPLSLLVSLGSHLAWRTVHVTAQPALTVVVNQISQPFFPTVASGVPEQPAASWLPVILLSVWACGFIGVSVSWWIGWRRIRMVLRTGRPAEMEAPIKVISAPGPMEPAVFGIRNPVLVLPEGIADRLTPSQWSAILAHELCHVRWRDNLTASLHMLVEALFWFHPLVWWIRARLVDARERACDEEVLRLGTEPRAYAEGILKVCQFYLESPAVCAAGVTGANLKRRIEAIMTGGISQKLDFARKTLLTVAGIGAVALPIAMGLLNAPRIFGQTNTSQYTFGLTTVAAKSFEVASVKPGPPGDDGWQLGVPTHGGITITNMQVKKIIASAFRTQDSTVNGPSWLEDARYTIVAKGPDPTVGNPVVFEMLRSLLAERFQLKYHVEAREGNILALVVAKGGHKLKHPEDGPCAEAIKRNEHCANLRFSPFNIGITNMPIPGLLSGLARIMEDRHLVDMTGLTGDYDVDVSWVPEGFKEQGPGSPPPHLDEGAMMNALQEQAGLKLEAQKGPIQYLVIDRIEKPSEN